VKRLIRAKAINKLGIFRRQGLTNGLIEVVHEFPRSLRIGFAAPGTAVPNCRLSASRAWWSRELTVPAGIPRADAISSTLKSST
jgi:hypothetical protein